MKKPYTLVCNSKKRKPYVLGRFAKFASALDALQIYRKRHEESRKIEKEYPSQGVEDIFCDLKILGPKGEPLSG